MPLAALAVTLFLSPFDAAVAALRRSFAGVGAETRPSGRSMAFERAGAVWLAWAGGSDVARIGDGVDPCISPDGTRVAYTKDTSAERRVVRHIAIVDLATRASRVLARVPGDNAFGPAWSPDGASLLVNVFAEKGWGIGLVLADDSSFRWVVKRSERSCWGAVFAADGGSIFCQDLESLVRLSLAGTRIWEVSLARLFPHGGLNSGARLAPSPDGARLLVDVDMDEDTTMKGWDGPPPAVFLVDLGARTARRVTPKGMFAWEPAWLDASDFLCITMHEGEREPSIVRLPLAGGPPVVLVEGARTPTVSGQARR
jgi:TolB protein